MKELSIEEKARHYDEVKNKLSRFIAQGVDPLITRADIQDFFPELKESEEDEKIRKALIRFHKSTIDVDGIKGEDILAWLEKQAEHANFRNNIQVGDKVTRNEAGILVNISQLNRIAKPRMTKPADKTEPKFHEGEWINGGIVCEDFNDGDGFYKVNLAYLSKSQVELIENLVVSWQTSANNSVEWGEEDKIGLSDALWAIQQARAIAKDENDMGNLWYAENWLKSLKQRIGE